MCIFCKIVNKEIPSDIVYENEKVICFHDLSPKAPIHILIVPKGHYDDILALYDSGDCEKTMGAVLEAVSYLAEKFELHEGFRLINNCREWGGQTVMHLHFHVLGKVNLAEDFERS